MKPARSQVAERPAPQREAVRTLASFWRGAAIRYRRFAAALAVFLAVFAACGWYLGLAPLDMTDSFSPGAVSSFRLKGFHSAETDEAGQGFRWTDGSATLPLEAQGPGAHLIELTLSAPRPTPQVVSATLELDGKGLQSLQLTGASRRYTVLVPRGWSGWGDDRLTIRSEVYEKRAPGDHRTLGVVVSSVAWRGLEPPGWLAVAQGAVIAAAAALLYLLLARAGIPLGPRLVALALTVAILVTMRHSDLRVAYRLNALRLTGGLALVAGAALAVARPQPGDGPLPWRAWLRLHWPALAGFIALTCLMHALLFINLGTYIYGNSGDALEYVWKLQLFNDYVVDRHQSPTFLPNLMYPEGFELACSEITPANTLLGIPLTRLWGPVASYNLLLLASYALAGFFAYLLVHRLGARRLAAFVGGIVFAFAIRHFFHATAGHLNLATVQYIPLAIYGLEGLIRRRRNWDAFVAALGLGLAAWASLYYAVTLGLFLVGYALLRIGLRPLPALLARTWRALALAAATTLALAAPLFQPYLELRQEGTSTEHGLLELAVNSPWLADYLAGNRYHPLLGAWFAQFERKAGGEYLVTLGYSVIALSLLGLWFGRPRRLAAALGVMAGAAFVLSLGPDLVLPDGTRYALPPVRLIYEHVPPLQGIRVWNRVVFFLVLCAGALAGLALDALPRRRYRLGAVAAALLLLGELAAVPPKMFAPGPRPVDLWLREQPGRGAVIELPVNGRGDAPVTGRDTYSTLFHLKPTNLWHGTFEPPLYSENLPIIESFPSPRAVALFQRWDTDYIIVEEWLMTKMSPEWRQAIAELPPLTRVYEAGGFSVYRIRP